MDHDQGVDVTSSHNIIKISNFVIKFSGISVPVFPLTLLIIVTTAQHVIVFQTFLSDVRQLILETKECHNCRYDVLIVRLHLACKILKLSQFWDVGETVRPWAFLLHLLTSAQSLLKNSVNCMFA